MDIVIQIIGFLGIGLSLFSFRFKKHKHILLFRTINEMIFIIQYFLLGAFSGVFLNILGCIRNSIFSRRVEKNKDTKVLMIVFSLLFTAFGILTFEGIESIVLILAKVLSTVAYGNKNTTVLRIISFLTHIGYLLYNAAVFSLAGMLSDTLILISLFVAIARFDVYPKLKEKN